MESAPLIDKEKDAANVNASDQLVSKSEPLEEEVEKLRVSAY